jgi:hypothetical protein
VNLTCTFVCAGVEPAKDAPNQFRAYIKGRTPLGAEILVYEDIFFSLKSAIHALYEEVSQLP